MVVRELFAKLGFDVDKASYAGAQRAMSTVVSGMVAIGSVAVAAAAGVGVLVHGLIETTSKLNDTSQATGISTDALQELGYAAQLNGSSLDELQISLNHLSRSMFEAKSGSKEAGATFSKLHVRVTEANGTLRSADKVMADIAEAFAKMPNGPNKTAIAMNLFGRSGAALIPTLNAGRKGLADMGQEAHDLGFIIDRDTITAGDDLGDNLDRLKAIGLGLSGALAGPLLSQLNAVVDEFREWFRTNKALINQRIEKVTAGISKAIKALVWIVKQLNAAVSVLIDNWEFFAVLASSVVLMVVYQLAFYLGMLALAYLRAGAAAVLAGLRAAAAWVAAAAGPIAISAAIAIAILLFDELIVAMQGGETLIGELWPKWQKWLDDFVHGGEDSDPWWLKGIRSLLYMATHLGVYWQVIVDGMKGALQAFGDWVKGWANSLGESISRPLVNAFDFVKNKLTGKGTIDVTASPGASSPTASAASRGAAGVVVPTTTNQWNITQLPNESGQDFAARVAAIQAAEMQRQLEETMAALG